MLIDRDPRLFPHSQMLPLPVGAKRYLSGRCNRVRDRNRRPSSSNGCTRVSLRWISSPRKHVIVENLMAARRYMGKIDTFDRAIADFSLAYADQAEKTTPPLIARCVRGRRRPSLKRLSE